MMNFVAPVVLTAAQVRRGGRTVWQGTRRLFTRLAHQGVKLYRHML